MCGGTEFFHMPLPSRFYWYILVFLEKKNLWLLFCMVIIMEGHTGQGDLVKVGNLDLFDAVCYYRCDV